MSSAETLQSSSLHRDRWKWQEGLNHRGLKLGERREREGEKREGERETTGDEN